MELLEKRLLEEGQPLSDTVLKVDSFINHAVDTYLMHEIGKAFADRYRDKNVTKVFTIESSGIAPAVFTAFELGVPLVILRKRTSKVLSEAVYQTNIVSFTKSTIYDLTLSAHNISEDDNVLIVDDFLANGEASSGAVRLVQMGGANVIGVGILLEKSFQNGRKRLEDAGIEVCSLVRIKRMDKGVLELQEADL